MTETQATASPIIDYEFNQGTHQVAWISQSAPGSIVGKLWVGDVDPVTGLFDPSDGRGQDIDTNCAAATAFGNGPEWVYGGLGTTLVYTKYVGSTPGADAARNARAWMQDDRWVAALLDENTPRVIILGTQTPGDDSPRVHYTPPDPYPEKRVYWRRLDSAQSEAVVPLTEGNFSGTPRRWVTGTHKIIFTSSADGQTYLYDTDSGSLEQLTFDASLKDDAFMWSAPEYGGEFVFFVAAQLVPGPGHECRLYRKVSGVWTIVNAIISSLPLRPWVWSPEPFTFGGASYIFAMLSPANTALNPFANTAITCASIADSTFLPLSDTTLAKFRSDPEWLVVNGSPAIYYNRYAIGGGSEGVWFVPTGI